MLSLGQSAPTEGYCQTWAAVRIDEGRFGDTDLAGVKFGFMADIPGRLGARQLDRGAVRRRQGLGAGGARR